MTLAFTIIYLVIFIFFLFMLVRLVFDWVQMFAREWRPKGFVLLVAEAVFTVTDPPLRAIRRVIPPLRLGSMSIDLAFFILIFACGIAMNLLLSFAPVMA
ncbi:YggT family protein [Spelaeicoccus albus]|uniref:YggT family protein n=1 Tax=Spelaeicoccus albus TaxID=1280376 RepID=A0A7Z0D4Y5_9MICO|nr:YggT family protein [Spelaeicoccus albus]NYI68984.1 YggT family protein [Spelaeicoccus albus]